MEKPMMKCGHRANGTDGNGKPVCVICAGIKEGFDIPVEEPDLSKRKCKCGYCKRIVSSDKAKAFFEYLPDEEFDRDYCGCRGWG